MKTVKILTATHVYCQPCAVSVSDAEAARLISCGVAVPCAIVEIDASNVEQVKEKTKRKYTRKKAEK